MRPPAPTPSDEPDYEDDPGFVDDPYAEDDQPAAPRNFANDALFGLALAGAVSLGMAPLTGTDADLRYAITWGMLILFGVLAWLFGEFPRIQQEAPEDVAWGAAFGLIVGIPLLAFGSGTLDEITALMFPDFKPGTVLAFVVFIMPMGETLFFRGIIQSLYPFWQVALIATGWNLLLFFPLINAGPFPLILGIVLGMVNALFGYVTMRNGLAAAWLCQITTNLLLLFFPLVA